MDYYNSSELDCHHRVFEPSLTKATIRPSLLPQNCMKFHFTVELKKFIINGSTEPMEQVAIHTSTKLLFDESTTMSEIRESLCGPLVSLPLLEQERRRVIQHACDAAGESVRRLKKGYANINLEFKLLLEHDYVYHEHYPMLKKYDVGAAFKNSDQDQSCSICLDDLYRHGGDEEVMCTPCDHVFHGDCIKNWLRNRSSCPLCRCEMGTT